jgi:hypothetical protein
LPDVEEVDIAAAPGRAHVSVPDPARIEPRLFDGGPPLGLQRWLGLVKQNEPKIARRAAMLVLVGWLPLVVLAIVQELHSPGAIGLLFSDFAVHARYLIAVPLLVVAEIVATPRLGAIAAHLVDAGLVRDRDRRRFDAAVASTLRARDSALAEFGTIAVSYVVTAATVASVPLDLLPQWHAFGSGFAGRSLMGWWHTAVSLPLLLVLVFGWIWRLLLWTRFLWLVSRLDLRLVAAHPDRAAGLMFIGSSVPACSLIGFALGLVVAGALANDVMRGAPASASYPFIIVGLVILVLVLFVGPLLMLADKLLHVGRQGVFDYGALASSVGREMERKWFNRPEGVDERALEVEHFSATTDLYQIVSNAYDINFLPVNLRAVILLIVNTLLPFLPVLFLALPFEVVFEGLAKFLM